MGNKTSKSSSEEKSTRESGHSDLDLSPDEQEVVSKKPASYWQMIKQGYQELVNAIIRPPRCQYELFHLGPPTFEFCGKKFQRTDFELTNNRGLKIVCSLWEPTPECRQNDVLPCVIYMHGNSSARVEALSCLSTVLSLGATLLSFDFCGSGRSEGDYVSLGAFEKDDLQCVIHHLRGTGKTSTIALWGRSMGAATALLHGERDPSIAGMILDSAFADLTMLAEEMVEKGRQHGLYAPGFVVSIAIRFIRSTVLKTANFDIKTLSPIEHADKCFIPAFFVAAEGDEFVPPHHSKKIFEKYAGDKNVIIINGDHNTPRPKFMFDSVSIFLTTTLQIPEHWILPQGQRQSGILPWHTSGNRSRKPSQSQSSSSHSSHSSQSSPPRSVRHSGQDHQAAAALHQAPGKAGPTSAADELTFDELLALSILEVEAQEDHPDQSHTHGRAAAKVGGSASSSSSSAGGGKGEAASAEQMFADQENSIGMTAARQNDIQGKLFTMLGDRGAAAKAASGNNNINNNLSSTTLNSGNNAQSASMSSVAMSSSCSAATGVSEAQLAVTVTSEQHEALQSQQKQHAAENDSTSGSADARVATHSSKKTVNWVCSTCTLVNLPDTDVCDACGCASD